MIHAVNGLRVRSAGLQRVMSLPTATSSMQGDYGDSVTVSGNGYGVAALFAHATWRSPTRTEPLHGTAAVRRLYDAIILYDGSPCTRHVVTNPVVELQGVDRAVARSYFTVFQARPDFPLQPILVGRYHDAFARADGAWRFADRLIVSDLIGDLSRHLRT